MTWANVRRLALSHAIPGAVVVGLFMAASVPFGVESVLDPTPGHVLLGAVAVSAVLPFVSSFIRRRAEVAIQTDGYQSTVVAWETRDVGELLEQVASPLRSLLNADSVVVTCDGMEGTAGDARTADWQEFPMMHRGEPVAQMSVASKRDFSDEEVQVLEALAASAAIAVANALATNRLQIEAMALERLIETISQRRRALLTAEMDEREKIAAMVRSVTAPLFDQLRLLIAAGDLDAAADASERLIGALRGVSSLVREV